MPWIYLVLVVVVLIVGLGVVVLNRRRNGGAYRCGDAARAPTSNAASTEGTRGSVGTGCGARARHRHGRRRAAPIVVERPNFRSRMSKARGALAGTLLGIRARTGITNETWDDLEEALLRADVGVRVTDDLLGGLRTQSEGQRDHRAGATARRVADRDGRSPRRRRSHAPLRRCSRWSERVAVRRRQRRRQDHHHRQGRRTTGGDRSIGVDGCGRHVPRRGRRATGHVGRAQRRRDRARQRGRRSRARSSSTPSRARPRATSISCSATPPVVCTPRRI